MNRNLVVILQYMRMLIVDLLAAISDFAMYSHCLLSARSGLASGQEQDLAPMIRLYVINSC